MLKQEKVTLTGEDMREGLTAIVSVKLPDPKFSIADQGQAGQLRSSPAARKPDERQDDRMARGASGRCALDHPEGDRRGRGARSGAQGARGQPQVGDGHRLAARQARRLPGARSRRSASCSWSRATAPAARPSRAATATTRRSCRSKGKILNVERARFDRMLGSKEIGTLIQALGTVDRPRGVQPREAALSQDRDHDRRRRRRRAHPHLAADLLLPPDAGADRERAPLHRPAAALQGQPRPLRSLSQGRCRARRLSRGSGARRAGARHGRRAALGQGPQDAGRPCAADAHADALRAAQI